MIFPDSEFEALVDSIRQSDMLMDVEQEQRSTWLKRVLPVAFALALSLVVHGAVPLWGRSLAEPEPARVSLSLLPMPPMPVPVVEDVPPPPPDEELPPEPPRARKPPPASERSPQAEKPPPEPKAPAGEPEPPSPAPVAPEPAPTPSTPPSAPQRVANVDPESPRNRRFDLKRMREESLRRAGLRNRLAAAKRKSGDSATEAEGQESQTKGASTPSLGGENRGNPRDVYDCGPTELKRRHRVREQRPLTDWVTVVPTALMPFRARPSLGSYLRNVAQVSVRRARGEKRAGPVEFALPAQVLQLELEKPAGARIALGLLAGRCLVGFRYAKELFPLTLSRVPARIVGPGIPATSSLVTVTLRKDGSFVLVREEGDALPLSSGYLKNHREIASNIENHYAAARALKEMASWVGVDLAKMAQDDRRKKQDEARKKRSEERKSSRKERRDLARRNKR